MRYAVSISTTPSNPAFHNLFKDFLASAYNDYPRTPKPIRSRIAKYSEELSLPIPKVYLRCIPSIAPWESSVSIDLTLTQYDRTITDQQTYQALFLELQNKYPNHEEFYTDGSKTNNSTGYAIANKTMVYEAFRLLDDNSIFTCKAFAILRTLQTITKERINKSIIYSDSLACLLAVENKYTLNPLIQNIQRMVLNSFMMNLEIVLAWVPSHQGIQGNENADTAAKASTQSPVHPEAKLTHSEAKKLIHSKITQYWDKQ